MSTKEHQVEIPSVAFTFDVPEPTITIKPRKNLKRRLKKFLRVLRIVDLAMRIEAKVRPWYGEISDFLSSLNFRNYHVREKTN